MICHSCKQPLSKDEVAIILKESLFHPNCAYDFAQMLMVCYKQIKPDFGEKQKAANLAQSAMHDYKSALSSLQRLWDGEMWDKGWISAKTRLPKDGQWVLVWLKGRYAVDKYDADDRYLIRTWYWSSSISDNELTHWQPLPEPPDVEKKEREICDEEFSTPYGWGPSAHCYQTKGHSGPHSTVELPVEDK